MEGQIVCSSTQLYWAAALNLALAAFTWSPWALSWAWLCLVGAHLCEALEGDARA